jgi:hypothetical protein
MNVLIVAGDRTGWPAWRNAAIARSSKCSDFIAQEDCRIDRARPTRRHICGKNGRASDQTAGYASRR